MDKIVNNYEDFNYHMVIDQIVDKIQPINKGEIHSQCLKNIIYKVKDLYSLEGILQQASLAIKKKLIYSNEAHVFISDAILNNGTNKLDNKELNF